MTSAEYFLLIFLIGVGGYFWLDGARAREFASAICRESCKLEGFQFLDDSVALVRLAPRWTGVGLQFRRIYDFDFSIEGVGRHTGFIILVGMHLETLDFRIQAEEKPISTEPTDDAPDKVGRLH